MIMLTTFLYSVVFYAVRFIIAFLGFEFKGLPSFVFIILHPLFLSWYVCLLISTEPVHKLIGLSSLASKGPGHIQNKLIDFVSKQEV